MSSSATEPPTHAEGPSTSTKDSANENLARLRELLGDVDARDRATLFPNPQLPRSREVWPAEFPDPPRTPPSTPSAHSNSIAASISTTSAPKYNSVSVIKTMQQQQQQQEAENKQGDAQHSLQHLRWYGGPPGVVRDVDYFTSAVAKQCNDFFRANYYLRNQPTAPLLRCPECAAHLLATEQQRVGGSGSMAMSHTRAPTSSRLWLDPPTLDRHLSWAHPDQLFTPQELAAYNDQVLHELQYSCGLASVAADCEETTCALPSSSSPTSTEWKTEPARLILAVDVANIEIGATGSLLDMLISRELRRIFVQAPVAICATHELFVPFTAKVVHVLYQLALLHPNSSLHVFVANTSLESGDLVTSAYLNELMLSSPSREVPPVVLLTRDGQQRQVAKDMHGAGQRTLSPVGLVRCSSASSVPALAEEIRAALTGSMWKV